MRRAKNRAEWQVNGTWYTADKVPAGATLKHWRLRGLDTVLLFNAAKTVDGRPARSPRRCR